MLIVSSDKTKFVVSENVASFTIETITDDDGNLKGYRLFAVSNNKIGTALGMYSDINMCVEQLINIAQAMDTDSNHTYLMPPGIKYED